MNNIQYSYITLLRISILILVTLLVFKIPEIRAQARTDESIAEIRSAMQQKDFSLADFLIARHLGASFEKGLSFKAHNQLVPHLKKHPSWPPLHMMSGNYSEEFIDFFSRGSWRMWGNLSRSSSQEKKKIILEEGIDDDRVVVIWGTPAYRNWYVLTNPKSKLMTVIASKDTRIIFGLKKEGGGWKYCSRQNMNRENSLQYVWKPDFQDLDDNGRKELLVRYNVLMGDGHRQVLDIYDLANFCSPELIKTFEGVHGIATYKGKTIVISNETSFDAKSILSQDKQRIQSFKVKNGKFVQIDEFVTDNFFWNKDWANKIKGVIKRAAP